MRFGWCDRGADRRRASSSPTPANACFTRRGLFSESIASAKTCRAAITHSRTGRRCTASQALAPERRGEALTYFHQTGPFGQALQALPRAATAREVAVVGLGVGTMASYARPGQRWTFFEIDPAIERIARTPAHFSFMEACGDRCPVVIGDARISLNRVPERSYDLLVLDAFSSDSIPIHLLTREAVALYLSRLAPDGVLVMHISNRHLTPRADRRPPGGEPGPDRPPAGRSRPVTSA